MDKHNPEALAILGRVICVIEGRRQEAISLAERAVTVNPNSAVAWLYGGWVHAFSGEGSIAVEYLQKALRLNPRDPMDFDTWTGLSVAFVQLERDAEAVEAARKAVERNPNYSSGWRMLAVSLALSGSALEAREALDRVLELEPGLSLGQLRLRFAQGGPAKVRYFEGLRLAGLAE